jgi:hypothetical protein
MRALLVIPALVASGLLAASGHEAGFGTITEDDVERHLHAIASAPLEGRDTPSVGLTRAGDYVIERFRAAGLEGGGPDGAFRIPWTRDLPAPRPAGCRLVVVRDEAETAYALEEDFVPLLGCNGQGEGRPVFCGFGIRAKKERYDDLRGVELEGNVAVILDGEPRHRRKFEGEIVTPDADLHVKLANLVEEGVSGVIVVRRPAADQPKDLDPPRIGFRHTWASWMPSSGQRDPQVRRELALAVVEVTPAVASAIVGADVLALAEKIDKSGKPDSGEPVDARVRIASSSAVQGLGIDNVVGVLRGTDPDRAHEYVVVGAHVDHVGVGVRGQIGYGADDNGSGTSALIEIVEALAAARPRRSILACAFSGEEDGLLGSRALARDPPVPRDALVAMINLDMIGRGEPGEVVVLGTEENPDLEDVLDRARKLKGARVKAITGKARHLWERSDHHSFHQEGVPVLFFFEAESENDNPDYHTWRDTIDRVDPDKIARTARLAYNVTWILAEDDERPSPPRGSR